MRFAIASLLALMLSCFPASASPRDPAGRDPSRADLVAALQVLHDWDARRALAWAREDEPALRALYVPGSGAWPADRAMLRDYRARGLVVRRMHTQVLAVEVLDRTAARLRLRVLDRVAGGEVRRGSALVPLRPTRPTAHTIELRRYDGRWRVLAVSGREPGPRAAPPRRRGR